MTFANDRKQHKASFDETPKCGMLPIISRLNAHGRVNDTEQKSKWAIVIVSEMKKRALASTKLDSR